MNKLRIGLEYGQYPIWLLDKEGITIDLIEADELGFNKDFCKKVQKLQDMYDDLFINNKIEFAYIGDKKPEQVKKIKKLYYFIVEEMQKKLSDKYEIQVSKF